MRRRKIIYRTATGFVTLVVGISGALAALHAPPMITSLLLLAAKLSLHCVASFLDGILRPKDAVRLAIRRTVDIPKVIYCQPRLSLDQTNNLFEFV